jgi:hypothetical protein
MGQFPLYKDWLAEAEKLHTKAENNPYGNVELGIQLKGAQFGSAVPPEVLSIRLGDASGLRLSMGVGNGDWQQGSYFRTTYTNHKEEFVELLETAKLRVAEKNKLSDGILYAMVADQIPKAIIKRMEGENEQSDLLSLLRMAVQGELEILHSKMESAASSATLKLFDISKKIPISFLDNEEEWTVHCEKTIASRNASYIVQVGVFTAYGSNSFAMPEELKLYVQFILHKKEIFDQVTKMTDFLKQAKNI